jgi:hypothetical protein
MTGSPWMSQDEWYASLDPATRQQVDQKVALLQRFNAVEPLAWVESELRENIPQVARFLFLHLVRAEVVNGALPFHAPEHEDFEKSVPVLERQTRGEQAYERLVAQGANVEDLVRIARAAGVAAMFSFLGLLDGDWGDEGSAIYQLQEAPAWGLMEFRKGEEPVATGRELDGLHESVCSLYPEDEE